MIEFLQGYLVGLGLIVLIGPVFFTLLQASLTHGKIAGLSVAWGIFISDVICVLICNWGGSQLFNYDPYALLIGILGAAILFGFGLMYVIRPPKPYLKAYKAGKGDLLNYFIKGFLVNFVNPFVFLVWLGIIGMAHIKHGNGASYSIYLVGTLLGILTTDSLKALFASNLKRIIKPEILGPIYRIIGVVLIIFGIRTLYWTWSMAFDFLN